MRFVWSFVICFFFSTIGVGGQPLPADTVQRVGSHAITLMGTKAKLEDLISKSLKEKSFDLAVEYARQLAIVKDSLNAIGERERISRLESRYESVIHANQLEILKGERRNQLTIIILLALLVLMVIVLTLLVVTRHRTELKLHQSERTAMEATLLSHHEAERSLKAELEFKSKELTSFTLNLIQKKEMLLSLRQQIEEVRPRVEGEARIKLNRIVGTINFSQRQDKDWDNFKLYFERVHHGFFDSLQRAFPDLNSNDLRLCALIKLNLDTKQIASVMDIAPESAKVAKHRIRKKLGLASSEELLNFFSKLSPDPSTDSESELIEQLKRVETMNH